MGTPLQNSSGYGPRNMMFSGQAEDFEIWSVKFKGLMRINKLHTILTSTEAEVDSDKNSEIFAIMVQYLDDKSLNLIIRDASDDGREAYKILQNHYLGTSKPRILALYAELTSLKMGTNEAVTEYMLRAETAATRLRQADEQVSDQLLIAMVLKGLPDSFKAFVTIIYNTDDKLEFPKFKTMLRSYEENEAARTSHNLTPQDDVYKLNCYNCGSPNHLQAQCSSNSNNKKIDKPKNKF